MLVNRFSDLHDYMIAELGALCPPELVYQNLYRASRDFCKRSQGWEYEAPAIDLVADQTDYSVRPRYEARIERIKKVQQHTASSKAAGIDPYPLDPSQYSFIPTESGGTIVLDNAPAAAVTDGLVVTATMVPHMGKHDLPPMFINRYAEAIIGKAMYELMRMKDRPWTNQGRAQDYLIDFNSGVSAAAGERFKKYQHQHRSIFDAWEDRDK